MKTILKPIKLYFLMAVVMVASCSPNTHFPQNAGTGQVNALNELSIPDNKYSNDDRPQFVDISIESKNEIKKKYQKRNLNRDWFTQEIDEDVNDSFDTPDSQNDEKVKKNNISTMDGQLIFDEALDFCDLGQIYWQKGELENALSALDSAYSLILEIDTLQDTKLIQQKEDLRFLISKRILEIYASRNIVVNGDHDEIPLEMNQEVQIELDRFTSDAEKDFFCAAYQRSGLYRPYIVEKLKNAGIPEELSWLPLIESGYKVKALSRSRALGLWQFIPSTGYKFGLKRDRYIDERMDFIKSTDAAIAYLKELHNIFGDWSTVLAAYNCGEGRVLQVIRTQNVNYLDNFWDLYKRLPQETARYVPRFFATLHIVKNPQQFGINHVPFESGLEFDTIEVDREIQIKDISDATGIDLTELKFLNPELRINILPPEPYTLRIPKNMDTQQILAKVSSIPISSVPDEKPITHNYLSHVVRPKETIGSIARRYQISTQQILKANNFQGREKIKTGKIIKIPQSANFVAQNKVASTTITPSLLVTHNVCRGDSLYNIAQRYGVTVKIIMTFNNLSSSNLSVGQSLKIPRNQKRKQPTKESEIRTYLVKNGDSLFAIARKHNMEFDHFLRINKLTARSKIFPGQKLSIQ